MKALILSTRFRVFALANMQQLVEATPLR